MKRKRQTLEVQADEQGTPQLVWYPSSPREVCCILDSWQHAGRWWRGEAERHYFLAQLAGGVVLELYREAELWMLSAIQD